MTNRDRNITPGTMRDLALVQTRCGDRYKLTPLSNTATRKLAKLGWIQCRVTKTYGVAGNARIMNVRVTDAGRAALAAIAT